MSLAATRNSLKVRPTTMAECLARLGGVPSHRVLMDPAPGVATEQDVLDRKAVFGQLCELVDGVLVEKTMGYEESLIAMELGFHLKKYLKRHRIGFVFGMDGPVRTTPPQVRMPDLSFIRKDRFPRGRVHREAVLSIAPDLAVEVLSRSNTAGEMRRKVREYFAADVKLVWLIDPRRRTARVYHAPGTGEEIGETEYLTGGQLLPGFKLRLKTLFDEALDIE